MTLRWYMIYDRYMTMITTYFRYSGYVYDAVWLYARVLDALIRKDKSLVQVKRENNPIFCLNFNFSKSTTFAIKSPENLFLFKENNRKIVGLLCFLKPPTICLIPFCTNTEFSHRKYMQPSSEAIFLKVSIETIPNKSLKASFRKFLWYDTICRSMTFYTIFS